MTKSGREIMEIFEAFDLTGTAWSAAQLTGCDAKTVARYVAVRDAGGNPLARAVRLRLIDGFMPKIEELVEQDLRVAWYTLETLTAAIGRAKADGSVARAVTRICRCNLIVVDLCRSRDYADGVAGFRWSGARGQVILRHSPMGAARFEGVIDRRREPVQAAGSWKCQMTSDGQWPAACAADGR